MNKLLLAALLTFPAVAVASPFVVSDPSPSKVPTTCNWWLDGVAKGATPVAVDSDGFPYCKIDMAGVSAGQHRVEATFAGEDPIWGPLESPRSAPLAFTRPDSLPAVTGPRLVK